MKYVTGVVKVALIVFIVLYCAFNTETQKVVLIKNIMEYNLPAFLPAVIGIFAGGMFVTIAFASAKIKVGRENKNLKKQLENAQAEIERLQNLSIIEQNSSEEPKEGN